MCLIWPIGLDYATYVTHGKNPYFPSTPALASAYASPLPSLYIWFIVKDSNVSMSFKALVRGPHNFQLGVSPFLGALKTFNRQLSYPKILAQG